MAAALGLLFAVAANGNTPPPNIVTILADDLGWFDTQIHNPDSPTSAIGGLVKDGLVLDRHYVFRYCSPTRRSFLSGRFPNHITNTQANTCSNYLPLEFSIISEKLAKANYASHFIGKGHLGYQTSDHLPINRGFDSHVGYLGGAEKYSYGNGSPNATEGKHDMWHGDKPGIDIVPEIYYSANFYTERAVDIIEKHDKSRPLWLHLPYQNVHAPYVNPPDWECHQFPKMWDATFANMLNMLDSGIANVTKALKDAGLYDNTLILFTADNGGIGPANNHPLRGHKHDPWEGGTRAAAFLSGGFLPDSLRGTHSGDKFVHISDWYATFASLAGVDPTDDAWFEGEVRPVDSVNVWPLLTGENATQPRPWMPTSEYGIIWGDYKLLTLGGQSNYYDKDSNHIMPYNLTCLSSSQPPEPKGTDSPVSGCVVCNSTNPCLFDIINDPNETTSIAADKPDIVARLQAKLNEYSVYGSFEMNKTQLDKYVKIDNPDKHWQGYNGPCYLRPGEL